jgi:hypothetical protein
MSKAVTHSRWIRGLQAGFDRFSLPKGAVSRISNMVYTRRGALKNCDGSLIFSAFGGINPFFWNPLTSKFWREVFYYSPSSSIRTGYFGLYSDPATPLATSLGTPTLATNGTGLTGTYFIKMTAVDGVGGESAASPEANIVVANQGIKITWTPVANAYGYNVYVATSSGAEVLWLPPGDLATAAGVSVIGSAIATIIIDNTWISNANQVPSAVDTSSQLIFTSIPIGGYSNANAVKTLPAAIAAISTGSSASIDTTSAPVTTTTQFKPTATAPGGPIFGTHAFDSATAGGTGSGSSFTDEAGHSDGGEQQTWSGFAADSGTVTAITISISSDMTLGFGANGQATLRYTLNNGSSWIILANRNSNYSATDSASIPIAQDLTQVKVSALIKSGSRANSEAEMEIFSIIITVTTLVASGGSSGSGGLGTGGGTPNGGVSGICSPLPMIVGFVGKMMLALGNGITPYQSDGTTAGTTQITNTFTAVYPARIASSLYNKGDQIEATVAGTAYVFTAQQEGTTSSGGAPAFAATLGSTVTDGQVVWKNTGQVTLSPVPRGAAHEEIYAGSLWLANTSPTLTTDQLDGPSALRQSDLNNPISWNPLNAAEISPDDGDECTGIKAFTVAEAGIAPQNFLMFFKNFSSYLIQGVFGSTNFSITRLQTDIGNVAARSIQFLPGYGIMRLSHLGFAVTDGISDKLQDPEAIRPLLFAETTEDDITQIDWSTAWFSKAAQTVEPPMYVCAMPLVGANANLIDLLTGVTVTVISSGSPMLPTGNYYVQAGLRGPNGVTSLSAISGPFAVVSGTSFLRIGNSALPAGYYGFRVWFGNSPTTLNQYVDGDATTINIQAPGSGGIPPTSIAGALTRVFCYDLIIKAWTVFDLPFSISVLRQSRIEGSIPLTIAAGRFDDSVRQMQAGDQTWDAGATNPVIQWSFKDAEVYDEGASVILFHNQVIIRGDDAPSSVNVTTEINGQVQAIIQASLTALGVDQYEARARIFQRAENLALTISGSGPATVESVTYEVGAKKPVGSSLVIA